MSFRRMRATLTVVAFAGATACTSFRSSGARLSSPNLDAAATSATGSAQLAQPTRQIVRHGRMDVGVKSLSTATDRLGQAARTVGAQIDRSAVEDRGRAAFLIRVPPPQLEVLMDSVATLGDVDSRSLSADDVTDRVIDAEARLVSLRASRDRLRQLLERSENVQDVIAVERELARVQGEIESLEGRLNALRGQVAMSELAVSLGQRPVLGPLGITAAGLGTLVKKLFVWR